MRSKLFLLVGVVCFFCARAAQAFDVGRYSDVKIAEAKGPPNGVVIFFSSGKKLSRADEDAAQALANGGALVVEVDTVDYLNRLDKINEKCHELVYDAEWASRQLQRERGFPNYLTPIVAGIGQGGTVAEMTLVQAPSATVAGAVSLDPSEAIASRRPICSNLSTTVRGKRIQYGTPKKLPGFWTVGLTRGVHKGDRNYVIKLREDRAPIDLHFIPRAMTTGEALRSLIEPHLVIPKPAVSRIPKLEDISGLPLAELPVEHASRLMAVMLSGDGGWRDLDKTVAEDLQREGVPVVGFDSLRYFWSRKTPEQTANAVTAVMETFMARWHADKVALVGYSFGADVIPFVYNRLPQDLKTHVALIALLGLSKSADFEISVGGWLGEPPGPGAMPVLPEAGKVPAQLMQCFYGQDETDTACPNLEQRGVETFGRNGGHHFDRNYAAVVQLILAGFIRRAG